MVFVLALAAGGTATRAQSMSDNGIFYHSFTSPWSSSLNPALFPESAKWYVALARTGADISLPFSLHDMNLQYDPQRGAAVFNATDFLRLLAERKCRFGMNADVNLVGIGFSIGPGLHFTFDAGARVAGCASIPLEVTRVLTEGNLNGNRHLSLGTTMPARVMAYAYASAGVSFSMPEAPVAVGVRFNLLDGYGMASIDRLTLDVSTAADTSSLTILMDYLAHYAGPHPISEDCYQKENEFLPRFMPESFGYTFDLGVKFKLQGIDISASLLDIGPGITWSNNSSVITPPEGNVPIQFDGIDVHRINEPGYFDGWKDTLLHRLEYQCTGETFRYTPPTRVYIGASYSLLRMLRVGYLFHGEWESGWFNSFGEGDFRMNNSLSLHFSLLDWLELTAANSFAYNGQTWDFFNPGMAVSLNPFRRLQVYAAIDYVSSFDLTKMRAAHVYFGINIFGHR